MGIAEGLRSEVCHEKVVLSHLEYNAYIVFPLGWSQQTTLFGYSKTYALWISVFIKDYFHKINMTWVKNMEK